MSGWIKWEKDLETDPRTLRMARELKRTCNALAFHPVTLVCGCLIRLWSYADSHIRDDNTLDLGPGEIDELLGVPNFTSIMPPDWLVKIDENTVELPDFLAHNGVAAKKKALVQKRVATHRKRKSVTDALPDQDQTKTINTPLPPGDEIRGLDLEAWKRWHAYRVEIRKPLKPASIPAAQKSLAAFGSDQSAVVEQSIAQGWQGLFPLKHVNGSQAPKGKTEWM